MLDGTTDVAQKFPASRRTHARRRRRVDDRLLRQRLHPGRDQHPARGAGDELAAAAVQRPVRDSDAGRGDRRWPGRRARGSAGRSASIRRSSTRPSWPASSAPTSSRTRWSRSCTPPTATAPTRRCSSSRSKSSNLQYLNTQTNIRLVQLVDADDVNADGSMSLVAPYRQPYDFVVAGDPRLFSDLLTEAGLDFVKTYADGIGPWKPYLVKTVADGVERTGDGVAHHQRPARRRQHRRHRARAPQGPARAHLDLPQRRQRLRLRRPEGGDAVLHASSASTACSPTSRRPASQARKDLQDRR